jgi:BirA family biotin operon repressor/biotin-[acetyl-CoA-carboxylase] ligase
LADATFDRAAFEAALRTRRLGRTLAARAELGSTNDAAWDALGLGAPDGTVVVADRQSAGRGRQGRAWHTTPGQGLALSVLVHQGCEPGTLGLLPLAAGLALARGLEVLGATAELKWPNDLLLGGRKVSGVLCESRPVPFGGQAAVIGVGVNVLQRAGELPEGLEATATSLAIEGCETTREAVAAAFLNAFEPLWTDLQEGGRSELIGGWRLRASCWGRELQVVTATGAVTGVARDLDLDGALLLEVEGGRRVRIVAGDVVDPPVREDCRR